MLSFFGSCFCQRRREVIALARPQTPPPTEEEPDECMLVWQMQIKETRNVCIQTEKSFNHERSKYRESNYGHVTVKEGPLLKVCSGGPGKLVRDVKIQSQTSCVKESRVHDGFAVIDLVEDKIGNLRILPATEATAAGERVRRL
jgi:hypothetical protein